MGRLVIVSNRVGSSLKGNEGGLATAMLAAFDHREVIWFGWSGEVTDEPSGPTRIQREGRLTRIRAIVPEAELYRYATTLHSITHGRGTFHLEHHGYSEAPPDVAAKVASENKRDGKENGEE